MKLIFFTSSLSSPRAGHHGRVLSSLLSGVADRGHHVLVVESVTEDAEPAESTYVKIVRYTAWSEAKRLVEAEAGTASALFVTSGFAEGATAVDWILDLAAPAHIYYSLDPWADLRAFEAEGASPWVRADQIGAFDLVFSLAGGPALDEFRSRWSAPEVAPLYETIDPATFYPRQSEPELTSDLALVADRDASTEQVFENFLLAAAKRLPNHRFVVAGEGWERRGDWPENVLNGGSEDAEGRAEIFSSARLVLVPVANPAIEYALPNELLEPIACGAACAVVDRPGLADFFTPDREILVPSSGDDLVPLLTSFGDARLRVIANAAQKRLLEKYAKLPRSRQFEQRVAKKFFGA